MMAANAFALLLTPAFVAYMNRFQIGHEEHALTKVHGADFTSYCRQVRRWL